MKYTAARLRSEAADFAYKNYLADSIYYYAQGKMMAYRYADILDRAKKPEDTRTFEEIVEEVNRKAGLEVRN